MKIMPESEFLTLVAIGHEDRNLEFKSGFAWNDPGSIWLKECVIQTILGLTNTPDGGWIVIGIGEDKNQRPDFIGLTTDQLASFSYDAVKNVVDSFVSSSIVLDIAQAQRVGRNYIVIQVTEFDEIPVICKKNGQKHKNDEYILREADIYTRPRSGRPGTRRATELELKELMEMAVDKGTRKLERRGWRRVEQEDKKFFEDQIKDF